MKYAIPACFFRGIERFIRCPEKLCHVVAMFRCRCDTNGDGHLPQRLTFIDHSQVRDGLANLFGSLEAMFERCLRTNHY